VRPAERESASRDAADLTFRIVKKSVVSGWPDADALNQRAFS
jgi:hypothetical protein